jgi:hypothetical protein
VRRAALKTLFDDPRFNVMDGLDVYIDDYSKADPLPEGWLEKMNQVRYLGHYQPPAEEAVAAAAAAEAAPAPPVTEAQETTAEPAADAPPAPPPQESAPEAPGPDSGA